MKIIFDNDMEKERFIGGMQLGPECPSILGLEEYAESCGEEPSCRQCWRKAVDSIELKEEER